MEKRSKNTIATADEVLEHLTKVMNGEEKDAFGLDTPGLQIEPKQPSC